MSQTLKIMIFWLAGLLAIKVFTACQPPKVPPPETVIRAMQASVLVMRAEVYLSDVDGPLSYAGPGYAGVRLFATCGGVAIASDRVVTAAHCVPEHATHVALQTHDQWRDHPRQYTYARVFGVDRVRDVAHLVPERPLAHWVRQAALAPPPEQALAILAPYRASLVRLINYELEGLLYEGVSGSGIFDRDGSLVGLVTACFERGGACLPEGQWVRP